MQNAKKLLEGLLLETQLYVFTFLPCSELYTVVTVDVTSVVEAIELAKVSQESLMISA